MVFFYWLLSVLHILRRLHPRCFWLLLVDVVDAGEGCSAAGAQLPHEVFDQLTNPSQVRLSCLGMDNGHVLSFIKYQKRS
ncbi:hypothetical protein ZWY2020_003139 [Hordeum vulgare]|nr:hypothetical protein ZWY2020_003139 [Hordeum vulgare]